MKASPLTKLKFDEVMRRVVKVKPPAKTKKRGRK
jgi:hypothetical protein